MVKKTGQEPGPVPSGTRVTVPAPGRVVNIIPDFLGHSILISHGLEPGGTREWISLLAHISPHPGIQAGQAVGAEQTAGWTKIFSRPRGMLCHLHLSLGLLSTPKDYALLAWPELVKRERLVFIDPLPLLPIRWTVWRDVHAWFAFLSRHIDDDSSPA
ncbi:MAG: hypothetical protein R6U55_14110 [Desulfovermiculus sp.]